MSRHINDRIIEAAVADLEAAFTGAPEEETPGLIRGGLLQENPVKHRIVLLVHSGDPAEENWKDAIVNSRRPGTANPDLEAPAYEVGGGVMWWRVFTVEILYFGVKSKEPREEARRIANAVTGRVEQAIRRSQRIPPLKDDFDEQCVLVQITNSNIEEGGGPPASFIWRGRLHFQVLTNRP